MPKIYLSELENQLSNPIQMIERAEKFYDLQITALANMLANSKSIKVVLLAGPSGSGKTTSANILKDKIVALGNNAAVISLDNFYKNKNEQPIDENGKPDWESIYALDVDLICETLENVIKYNKADIPIFDFISRNRSDNAFEIDVGDNGTVIIEGIHALNPLIVDRLPKEKVLSVYVSVSTGIKNDEKQEILRGVDLRMVRRTIRDMLYRGTKPIDTVNVWGSVRLGEHKYLNPFKNSADYRINTFHAFEPFLYAQFMREHMMNVMEEANVNKYYKIYETVFKLPGIDLSLLPDESLIREFVSGGKYEHLY